MPDIHGSIYDYPKYYDLLFGSDWKAEFDFLQACFERHSKRKVTRVFEPACGTGRLLIKLAQAGYEVSGLDLNRKAIDYCNDRLERHGFDRSTFVADMADFRLKKKVHAAFNMINSFRHLPTEDLARAHLQCVADSLVKGGLYLLALHLTPTRGTHTDRESWSARRGNLAIVSQMWTKKLDRRNRMEHLGMTLDIYTPTRQDRIVDHMEYRMYTAEQMDALLATVPDLKRIAVYDFVYDMNHQVEIDARTEDVVLVLQKV